MYLDEIKRYRERERAESLNWLNNKLRFGGGFRFMKLPVFFILLLIVKNK